jgi:hypothetical protein
MGKENGQQAITRRGKRKARPEPELRTTVIVADRFLFLIHGILCVLRWRAHMFLLYLKVIKLKTDIFKTIVNKGQNRGSSD